MALLFIRVVADGKNLTDIALTTDQFTHGVISLVWIYAKAVDGVYRTQRFKIPLTNCLFTAHDSAGVTKEIRGKVSTPCASINLTRIDLEGPQARIAPDTARFFVEIRALFYALHGSVTEVITPIFFF